MRLGPYEGALNGIAFSGETTTWSRFLGLPFPRSRLGAVLVAQFTAVPIAAMVADATAVAVLTTPLFPFVLTDPRPTTGDAKRPNFSDLLALVAFWCR